MAILDDLKGILSAEDFAKLDGNATLKTKLTRGDELRSYYEGEDEPPAARQDDPPPARREPPAGTGGAFDLSAIERMFDTRLGKLNETIETKIADVVKTRGDELVNNAVKIAVQRSDELNRIYARNLKETGEEFDTVKFNEFLEKPEIKAKGFRTLTDAYEAYAAPVVLEREVERRVDVKLKEKSGTSVPGTTPPPSTNSNIAYFKKRAVAGDGSQSTGASRAAAMLDRISAEKSA